MTRRLALVLGVTALLAGCGGSSGDDEKAKVRTVDRTTSVEVVPEIDGGATARSGSFDANGIYERDSPGVVTVFSLLDRGAGQGSGFVLNARGEIATNAHVVTEGEGGSIRKADQVFVQFADRNQVPARIVGFDANADVALLKIDPEGLTLRPLGLGTTEGIVVGDSVAAIGSPSGEPQSLSVGVVSALNRSIESLTGFTTSGAIQTDAAIDSGNSGGPLIDARGRVVGINSQVKNANVRGQGFGFAVNIDTVRRSLDQLRDGGKVDYAFLGVSTTSVYPQLAERFDLRARDGAWVQSVERGGPADDGGIEGPSNEREVRFQAGRYATGGDVITKVGGRPVRRDNDLGLILQEFRSGQSIDLEVVRDGRRRTLKVRLGERPPTSTG